MATRKVKRRKNKKKVNPNEMDDLALIKENVASLSESANRTIRRVRGPQPQSLSEGEPVIIEGQARGDLPLAPVDQDIDLVRERKRKVKRKKKQRR